ncbi:hypothetical protein [Ramlibacter sp. WS9]|uniref:hypothetical protein n=1 Tax=Ramlibacter sp. WS9 TaxID=1882741 RepID=UPI00114270D7|nr:hypothetical protein [Ramlibacter sp. WS9]
MDAGKIRLATLKEMAAAGGVTEVLAVGVAGGYALSVECASAHCELANDKGERRCFANLNTLSSVLKACGIQRFQVDASAYVAGRLRKARPDRSEALKRTKTQQTLTL